MWRCLWASSATLCALLDAPRSTLGLACNHHVLCCAELCCSVCRWLQVFRRAAASVVTLGSGASLGPEAPSVELGANTAAVLAPKRLSKRRQRMLVAAGAAAG